MGKTEIREVRTEVLDGHGGGDPAGTPGCTSQLCSSVTELFKIGPPPLPSPEASVAPSVKWSRLSGMTLTVHQDP